VKFSSEPSNTCWLGMVASVGGVFWGALGLMMLKLPAFTNTHESTLRSPPSAIASFTVFGTFGVIATAQVSVVVRPSAAMSIVPGIGVLGRKREAFDPALMVLMVIGTGGLPTFAQFTPLTRSTKPSTKGPPTNCGYSSEANTYWKYAESALATTSKLRDCPRRAAPG